MEKTRSIKLPEFVWDALDADADRCRRSSQKQIESLLVTFYEIEDVEISQRKMEILGEIMPTGKKGIKVLPNAKIEKKKAG